jgi:hypothetical protein
LLISEAVTEAVAPLSFDALHGRQVFVDDRYFESTDKAFVLGELRAKLFRAGVQLAFDMRDAEIILEVRSPGWASTATTASSASGHRARPAAAPTRRAFPRASSRRRWPSSRRVRQVSFAGVAYVAYWPIRGKLSQFRAVDRRAYSRRLVDLGFGPRTLGNIPPVDHHVE